VAPNPNIVALQAAERLLREHDARIAEAAAEVKRLRAERKDLADRVQQCIDVLCGRATPDLFSAVDQRRADELAAAIPTRSTTANAILGDPSAWADLVPPGPVVCAPVGAGRLADIPGITEADTARLADCNLHTLADLEETCGGDLSVLPAILEDWLDGGAPGDADRIAKAVERHLKPASVPPVLETGVRYPAKDDWRKQGLALMGLNDKLLKACKKQEVLTVGDLHDWIDEETRDRGGFFGPGVLASELERIGKIATKWAKANAEILYQFFADQAFLGVPEKEAV
jgi:hypothetical protein